MLTPLQVRMALAYAVSQVPAAMFPEDQWRSRAADEARTWLRASGLVDHDGYATDKLHAYVEALCALPLPVCKWVIPKEANQ